MWVDVDCKSDIFRECDDIKQVVDYVDGGGAFNRIVDEGDEDERDGVWEL